VSALIPTVLGALHPLERVTPATRRDIGFVPIAR
jgi:hypothetical protein